VWPSSGRPSLESERRDLAARARAEGAILLLPQALLMACTHQASAAFLLWQMRYYLLRQPFEQCVANYIDVV